MPRKPEPAYGGFTLGGNTKLTIIAVVFALGTSLPAVWIFNG